MKKYVIGDIRGEVNLLKSLIQKLGPTSDDQLIFTGSYLGPGSDSKGVIEYIIELQKKLPKMAFLKGCYEFMFGSCIETKPNYSTMELWGKMGGQKVFKSYSDENIVVMSVGSNGKPKPMQADVKLRIPASHLQFIENLHQWFEDDLYPYVVCHAGGHPLLYGGQLDNEEQVAFGESGWWEQEGRRIPGKTVIFSHAPFKVPFCKDGKIGIDCGAGIGGRLCSYEMFTQTFTIVG